MPETYLLYKHHFNLFSKDDLLKLHKLEHKRLNEAAKMTKDAGMYCNDLVVTSSHVTIPCPVQETAHC